MDLKHFMNIFDFKDMKKTRLGDNFCIDFNSKGTRICWFDTFGGINCGFDHFKITKKMTETDFISKVNEIQRRMDKIECVLYKSAKIQIRTIKDN